MLSHYGGGAGHEYQTSILESLRAGVTTFEVKGCAYPEMARSMSLEEALRYDERSNHLVIVDPSRRRFLHQHIQTMVDKTNVDEVRVVDDGFIILGRDAVEVLYKNGPKRVPSGFDDTEVCPIASPWIPREGELVHSPIITGYYATPDMAIAERAYKAGLVVLGKSLKIPEPSIRVRPGNAESRKAHRITTNYAVCLLSFGALDLDQQKLLWNLEKAGVTIIEIQDYPYLDHARSIAVREALALNVDGVFFLDHDIIFRARDLLGLCERASERQEMVAAAYCMRRTGKAIIGAIVTENPGDKVTFFKGGGLYSALYSGLGFAAIPSSTLQKLDQEIPPVVGGGGMVCPMFALDTAGSYYSGEDVSFCSRVINMLGQKVWIDTSVRIFHRGSYDYGIEDANLGVPRYETAEAHAYSTREDARRVLRSVDELPDAHRFRAVGLDEGAVAPHEGLS